MEGALGSGGVYVFAHYLSWLTLADVQVRVVMVGIGTGQEHDSVATVRLFGLYVVLRTLCTSGYCMIGGLWTIGSMCDNVFHLAGWIPGS